MKNILIPGEEEQIEMHPMDYEEFMWALGDETYSILRQLYELQKPLGDGVNRKKMRDFRLYMLVGGMPQAVAEYIESHDLVRVDKVKRNILDLYEDDFRKIDTTGRLSLMLRVSGDKLYYYTFPKDASHSYEIDFLVSRGAKICPIEVKSSGYKTHTSLDAFCEKFSSRIDKRYLVYTKDLRKEGNLFCLPVYMTGLL